MHIPRGRRHCVNLKTLFCLFSCWLYGASSYALLLSSHHVCFGHAYFLMLLCFIECMFGWSIALLCDLCSHFYMTVLVFDQVSHMFHNMFTWLLFTCYIILVFVLTLMCFVQVFQVTSIYVPSASQLLITTSHHFEGEKL